MATIQRTTAKLAYYARNVARDCVPQALFRRRLDGLLARASLSDAAIFERVKYYHATDHAFTPSAAAVRVRTIPTDRSMYYYDLKEFARYFDPDLRIDLEFGDVVEVPPVPSIVKSRPLARANANAILFKLNKFRHFQMPPDMVPFERKLPMAVWRGTLNNPLRTTLLQAAAGLPFCDVGATGPIATAGQARAYLGLAAQRRFRYIISVEGYDVATNLKWILNSNSLCLMAKPKFETWFGEGRLIPDVHYVALEPDFSDIAERFHHFEKHPDEARRITAAARAYCRPFQDEPAEHAISLLVLYKYFVLSGQITPDPQVWRRLAG